MTKNRAAKTAARTRKTATGLSYTAARRTTATPNTLTWGVRALDHALTGIRVGSITTLAGRTEDGPGRLARQIRTGLPFGVPSLHLGAAHADLTDDELAQHVADYGATHSAGPVLVIVDRTEGITASVRQAPANVALLIVAGINRCATRPFGVADVSGPVLDVTCADMVLLTEGDDNGHTLVRVLKSRRGNLPVIELPQATPAV